MAEQKLQDITYLKPGEAGKIVTGSATQASANAGMVPVSPSMSLSDIKSNPTPMPLATPAPVVTPDVSALSTETPKIEMTQPEQEVSSLSKQIQDITSNLTGQTVYKAEQEKAQGMEGLLKTQTDLASQLKAIQSEAQAIPLQLQEWATGRGVTAGGLAPLQTARLRTNAIQALQTSALLEASKNNIALAQNLVDRAVEQKFGPDKEKRAALLENIKMIKESPEYTIQDKNRAMSLEAQLKKQEKEDAKKASDYAETFKIATDAAKNGADSVTLQKITQAKTPFEALQFAGEFVKTADQKTVNDLIKKYPDAGITSLDTLYQAQEKLKNSAIYKKSITQSGLTISPTTRANMVKDLVASGLSVDEANKRVTEIIGSGGTTTTGIVDTTVTQTGTSRTDRNNNPTAMTTDVAKTLGLVEGVDFVKGDPFKDERGNTLYTAKLLGDSFASTIKALDLAASDPSKKAFYSQSGGQRWTHTAMSDEEWLRMTPEQKKAVVQQMYVRENGPGGSLFAENQAAGITPQITPDTLTKYNPDVIDIGNKVSQGEMSIDNVDKKIQQNVRNYISDAKLTIPLTEQQIKTLDASDEAKQVKKAIDLKSKIEKYKTLFDTYGTELYGTGAAALDSAFADLKIAWKEAANLGALTGPDVAIIGQAIKSATGFEGKKNALLYGEQGIKDSIESALSTLLSSMTQNMMRLKSKNKQYESSDYIKELEKQAGTKPMDNSSNGATSSGLKYQVVK